MRKFGNVLLKLVISSSSLFPKFRANQQSSIYQKNLENSTKKFPNKNSIYLFNFPPQNVYLKWKEQITIVWYLQWNNMLVQGDEDFSF